MLIQRMVFHETNSFIAALRFCSHLRRLRSIGTPRLAKSVLIADHRTAFPLRPARAVTIPITGPVPLSVTHSRAGNFTDTHIGAPG